MNYVEDHQTGRYRSRRRKPINKNCRSGRIVRCGWCDAFTKIPGFGTPRRLAQGLRRDKTGDRATPSTMRKPCSGTLGSSFLMSCRCE